MKFMTLTAVLFCFTSTAFGAGFQLRYQGAESMGTGFSSAGSYGDSLSSIYYNPGLFLTQDKDRAVSLEVMAIYPTKAEFTSSTGTTYDDFASTSISGAFYFGYKVDDSTAFTVALTTPWGTSTDYDTAWDGRYHALETDLAGINLQTMMSKKLSEKFIISVGPQIQQLSGTLSTAVPTANTAATDIIVNFDADNISAGGVLALTYMPTERTTIGFNYTSRIKHTLRGDFTATPSPNAFGLVNSDDADTEITTPDVFTLGATHSISEKLLAHLSFSYTNWSVFKELTVSAENAAGGGAAPFSNTVPQDWDDTYMIALGSTYKMSEKTVLRGGLSYETGAVENAVRTPRSQDADRIGLGLGASFMLGVVKLDLGLNHVFYQGDITVAIPDVPAATVPTLPGGRDGVTGSYDNSATLLRAGLEYVF